MDDVFLFVGLVLIVAGVWMIYIPAALITAGAGLICIGLLIGKKNALAAKSIREQRTENR